MSHALRSIAFGAELIHPPVQHDPRTLQALHAELFGDAECAYRDFKLLAGGAMLSNAFGGLPGTPVSSLTLLPDRIQVREEQTGAGSDDFERRIEGIARTALSNLPMAVLLVQQYVVRAVVNPDSTDDARAFMLRDVFGFDEQVLAPLVETPTLAGLRLAFPPRAADAGIFNVRLESFSQDNRSLFLETIGTFSRPVQKGDVEPVGERFGATYAFLEDRLLGFVHRFDREREP